MDQNCLSLFLIITANLVKMPGSFVAISTLRTLNFVKMLNLRTGKFN